MNLYILEQQWDVGKEGEQTHHIATPPPGAIYPPKSLDISEEATPLQYQRDSWRKPQQGQ